MTESASERRFDPWPLVLGLLLLGSTVMLFLVETHHRAGVWLAAPLDDTFIHFQYAKQLARARLLQFNDGDTPSTGATSLLYLLLLAPGWLVGFRGLLLLVWAWLLNGALHLIAALALFGLVKRLTASRPLAFTAQAAYLLGGALLWGSFSHMEVALFSCLLVLTLGAAVRLEEESIATGDGSSSRPPRLRGLLVLGALLALVRPEGALLAGGLSLWLVARRAGARAASAESTRRRSLGERLRETAPLLAPLAAGLAMLLLFLALTGRISTNAAIKSHLATLGDEPLRYLETTLGWLPMPLQILLEKWPSFLGSLTAALAISGLALWAVSSPWRRPGAGALVLGWLLLLALFYALAVARRDHFDRYYLPYFSLALVPIWWALGRLGQRGPVAARGVVLASGLLLVFMVPDTVSWARRFGDNCRDLTVQHFQAAQWLREHTPAGTRIAVNDAGAIPYLSGRYSYDLVGLVHNAFFRKKNHMPGRNGPVWEALERLRDRPELLVAYPEWFPDLVQLPVLQVRKRFPLTGRTMVANDVKVIWRFRWDLCADSSAPPTVAGMRLQDRLDVADLDDEQAHRYRRLDGGVPDGSIVHERRGERFIVDAGRRVGRGESFTLRTQPGRAAQLLLRSNGPGKLDVDVEVDGQGVGCWRATLPAGPSTPSFPIPAAKVRSEAMRVRLVARSPYSSFHYWLMQ